MVLFGGSVVSRTMPRTSPWLISQSELKRAVSHDCVAFEPFAGCELVDPAYVEIEVPLAHVPGVGEGPMPKTRPLKPSGALRPDRP